MSGAWSPAPLAELPPDRLVEARRPLARAGTLPAEAFTSAAIYDAECQRLFARSWLCAGREDQVPEPGDYFSLDLLDDRLVVVRGADRAVRVLSRVCRHRGAELVTGSGNTRSFQCPYHAWTYRLDGRLVGAPLMDGHDGFDRERCRLPEIRSETWQGWVFVNFDADAPALGPQLEPLAAQLERYRMEDLVALETARFDSPFNWKVLVDNFMEAYHHIAIHRDTLEPLFPAERSHTPDNQGPYSVLFMPGREGGDESAIAPGLPQVGPLRDEEASQLVAAVVYPFHLFAPGAQSMAWYQILPERHDRFTLRIFNCFPREALEDASLRDVVAGFQEVVKAVHHQDIVACEATWAGLQARSFEAGHLGPLEKPIWQFNQWWLDRMGVAEPSGGS